MKEHYVLLQKFNEILKRIIKIGYRYMCIELEMNVITMDKNIISKRI